MISLYIKTHNQTGLKYFGKTKNDPLAYRGSGVYWTRHIKKHGYDVDTEILGEFEESNPLLEKTAIEFSNDNNIVESNEWANLEIENGLNGGTGVPITEENRKKTSERRKGTTIVVDIRDGVHKTVSIEDFREFDYYVSVNKGRKYGEEYRDILSKARKGKPAVGGVKQHSDKTKALISEDSRKRHQESNYGFRDGKIGARDLRDGNFYRVSKEDFKKYDYYVGNTSKKENYT